MHICVSPLFSCHIGNAIRISFSFLRADTPIRPYGKKSARRIVGADQCIRPQERVFFIMWLEIVFHPTPAPPLKREGSA